MTDDVAPERVLVTGASGTIGTAVTSELAERGIAVTALSIGGVDPAGADRVVHADVTDPEAVRAALDGADAVVHLAAIPHPRLGTPFEVYRTNVVGTFAVLSQAAEAGVRRVVLASSINASGVPFDPRREFPAYYPIDEDLPPAIGDAYSLSKRADEEAARMAYRAWGIDSVALRFPFTHRADRLRETAAALAADPSRTVREGWAYLDVRDAARAVHRGLVARLSGAHVLLVAADDTLLDGDTEELLRRWAPGVPLRAPLPGRTSGVDTRRARELLGFVPRHSINAAD